MAIYRKRVQGKWKLILTSCIALSPISSYSMASNSKSRMRPRALYPYWATKYVKSSCVNVLPRGTVKLLNLVRLGGYIAESCKESI